MGRKFGIAMDLENHITAFRESLKLAVVSA